MIPPFVMIRNTHLKKQQKKQTKISKFLFQLLYMNGVILLELKTPSTPLCTHFHNVHHSTVRGGKKQFHTWIFILTRTIPFSESPPFCSNDDSNNAKNFTKTWNYTEIWNSISCSCAKRKLQLYLHQVVHLWETVVKISHKEAIWCETYFSTLSLNPSTCFPI